MNLYYPTRQLAIAPNTLVRRERLLPVAGEVIVRVGSRVEPDDVVASAIVPAAPVVVEVAQQLGVSPEQADKLVTRRPGEEVEAGDVIAARRGLGQSSQVRAPVSGTMLEYDTRSGLLAINPPTDILNLPAHIKGIVIEQYPFRGVAIETPAAVVRGIFGFGEETHGVLKVGSSDPAEELLPDQIDARLTYSIVLGGGTTSAEALFKAVEHGVRGVIVGSIPEPELRAFMDYPQGVGGWSMGRQGWEFPPRRRAPGAAGWPKLTLIVVEGFGRVPMAPKAWELLAAYDGQEVAAQGNTRLRGGLTRPEVVVPLARADVAPPLDSSAPAIEVGSQVRLVGGEYLGRLAQVRALSNGKRALPSGIMANAADLQLADGTRLWAPLYNLEVIEAGARA